MSNTSSISNIEYCVVKESDTSGVIDLLGRSFCQSSPIEVALNIKPDEYIKMISKDIKRLIVQNLSVAAFWKGRATPVGVLISSDIATGRPEESQPLLDAYRPVAAYMEKVEQEYAKDKTFIKGEKYYLFMVGVDSSFQGKGIARRLLEKALILARERGFKQAVTVATNNAARFIAQKSGFKEVFTMPYADFMYEGKYPFISIEKQLGATVMEKDLL